ncbi:hypothetical protein Hanom_Chr12g01079621 [Helianthus anomalus]
MRVTTCQTTGTKSVILKSWGLKVKFHQTTGTMHLDLAVQIASPCLVDCRNVQPKGSCWLQSLAKLVSNDMNSVWST